MRWLAVVPVKPLPAAKTRLRGAVPEAVHPGLVVAMALDTVGAVLACPLVERVVVVCDDPAVTDAVAALGATVLPDRPAAGLNAALTFGAEGSTAPVAALAADLPALRTSELAAALTAATSRTMRGYVPDAAGTGTVLLTAPAGLPLRPRFGPGSAAAHAAGGARDLTKGAADWPGLRHDVDTAEDLATAVALGVGPHTRALLRGSVGAGAR